MSRYLLTEEDGLLMRSSGPWAAEKLDYVARYINVFETSMRDKWQVRCYIDLMAGPGKNRVGDAGKILLGSSLLALTTDYPFTNYFFADLSQENTDALQQRCSVSPLYSKVDIRTGDCNSLVDGIVDCMRCDDNRSLNLAFLDPEGMELRWETVAKLASMQRMDLIINYPQGGLNRNMGQESEAEKETSIDRFFGDRKWREIYEKWTKKQLQGGIHHWLIDHYKRKLQVLNYHIKEVNDTTGEEPLIRNIKRRAPLYRLLFASKHPLGDKFWQQVTRRDVYGRKRLF